MLEAIPVVRAERNVERGRKLAHRVIVAVEKAPVRAIEAVAVGVETEPFGRVGLGIEAEEDETDPPCRIGGQMLLDPHHVGHERRTYVLAGRVSHRENDELAGERRKRDARAVLVRPLPLEIVERGAGRLARIGRRGDREREPCDRRQQRAGSDDSWRASRAAKADIVGGIVGFEAGAHRVAHESRIVGRVCDAGRRAAAERGAVAAVGIA